MDKIKVLIVDDSKLVREILVEILSQFPLITIVGQAEDAFQAREMIKLHSPDVLTLDVEMPKMDGITFLRNLMRLRPMPVVMLSTLTTKGAEVTLEALELGAVDFIAKPKSSDLMGGLTAFNNALFEKIKFASTVDVSSLGKKAREIKKESALSDIDLTHEVIALGASTGGTEALRVVLDAMPADSPPIVITQHIPQSFSLRFAKRLNGTSLMTVHEARDGLELMRGHAYVAPGNMHLKIIELNGKYYCRIDDGPLVNRHKPSVDVMFNSLLGLSKVKVFAGLLTGMGSDGAKSLLSLKEHGHFTLIQDEQTSMVWGMPGVAQSLNAHCREEPLPNVARTLLQQVRGQAKRASFNSSRIKENNVSL